MFLETTTVAGLIRVAGALHFSLLIAGGLAPRVLDWRRQLSHLSQLSRRLIWVHGAFIALIIIGFGCAALLLADELTAGTPLARSVCGFIGLFWLTRLIVQFFVFDASPHLTRWWLTAGYHGLTVLFFYFAVVFTAAATM